MGLVKPQNALSLTPELWAKVFSYLEDTPQTVTIHETTDLETNTDLGHRQNQKEVHQIKLVCKEFREVHASHPGVVRRLYLSRDFNHRSFTSLLPWLQRNKSTIRICQSMCLSPPVNAVPEPSLKEIHICNINNCSVSVTAAFTGLERCVLRHEREELGLAPLGVLPKLKHLVLEGAFRELQHLARLTHLECNYADVSSIQDLKCASVLQHLEVHCGNLSEFQTEGLSICTGLTQLVWNDSILRDNSGHLYLDTDLNQVPERLVLSQLHTLQLSTGVGERPANLGWISELSCLQDLSISFGISYGQVMQHALQLTRLTRLSITGLTYSLDEAYVAIAGNEIDQVYVLSIDVEWQRLQALQELFIFGCKLKLGSSVAGLLQLPPTVANIFCRKYST